jgi:CubicO group peptidase (beta-lactamase class C family)
VSSHSRIDFGQLDQVTADFAAGGRQPGVAYGIVIDGELVHAWGAGEQVVGGGQVPGQDTVFRIASMSKSFTASVILSLRDEGALALDDPAASYVPELRGWAMVTPDARPVTLRNLLTMTAGFPTDDPWGDRQQGLPLDEFGKLLADGVSAAWAPGTRFEYSNLGYAILGRVITEVAGAPYKDVVRDRFLVPLGMTATGYEAEEFAAGSLAVGYRKAPGGWEELPWDPYGAFAPMGGVFSTVSDLAIWVAGFAAAFPPGAGRSVGAGWSGKDNGNHPLRAASRREMQLPHALLPDGRGGYGYGLFISEDTVWGRIVSHSGGYPGFGTNMRWHPASRTGAIALGNGTYAPTTLLAGRLLDMVLRQRATSRTAIPLAPGQRPWPETLTAADTVNGLLRDWDDDVADALFAPNVALDAPYPERRDTIAVVRDRIGDFTPDPERNPESDTPAHRRWWLTGDRGTVQVQIQLSPQRPPLVQSLRIAVPPAEDSALDRAMERVVMAMNDGECDWPTDLPVTAGTDVARLSRRLRMAAVWTGTVRRGVWHAGDGETTATADLTGKHATVRLTVTIAPSAPSAPSAAIRDLTLTGF